MHTLTFKINEVSLLSDLPIDTIRYYDKIGLLVPHKNPHNNYREYTLIDLIFLDYIKFLRDLDVPLKDIQSILVKNSSDQYDILKKHHTLLKNRIELLQKLETKLSNTLENASQIENNLNTYTTSHYPDRYFKHIGLLSYYGTLSNLEYKKNLIQIAKEVPDSLNKLLFIIDPTTNPLLDSVDIMLSAYIEVDASSPYDLHLNPTFYFKKILKTTDMHFKENYQNTLEWVASQNFTLQEPILLKFLDTSFYFQEYDESLIQLQIPYTPL